MSISFFPAALLGARVLNMYNDRLDAAKTWGVFLFLCVQVDDFCGDILGGRLDGSSAKKNV